MAHFHTKKKKGRPYLYVREIARVNGRPKVVSQIYIGSPNRVAALARGESEEDRTLRVEEFGSLWLANQMDRGVDLAGIVDSVIPKEGNEKGPSVGEYFLYCALRHWTDSKIRCHLFTCVATMTYLRMMELKLNGAGIQKTAADVMDDMRHLHSVLTFRDGRSTPRRRLETPTKTQAEVLASSRQHTPSPSTGSASTELIIRSATTIWW